MAQGQFNIRDTSPTAIIPYGTTVGDAQLLTNIGANTVWLGNDSTVNVTSGLPLAPGANKVWESGQALYAVCTPGALTTLQMIDNTGSVFDPTAIGNATGIALLAGGLAGQIATAINLLGVPPIDRAANLLNDVQNVAFGAGYNTAIVDCSQYNSLSIQLSEVNGAAGSCMTPREVFLFSYADPGGAIFMDGRRYTYFPSNGSITITPSMSRGPYLQVGYAPLAAGAAFGTITSIINGSMRTTGTQERVEIANSQVRTFTVLDGDPGLWQMSGNVPIGTTSEYPVTYSGPATLGWEVGAITTQGYVRFIDQITGAIFAALSFPVSASAQRGFQTLYLPERAIRVDVLNANAAVLAARLALTMDGNR